MGFDHGILLLYSIQDKGTDNLVIVLGSHMCDRFGATKTKSR